MLKESKETIFQMKDAMYFSFKELQLNMDNYYVIYTDTLFTWLEVAGYWFRIERLGCL